MSAHALAPVRRRPPAEDPFATLNDEQRAAVFHGAALAAPPLLIHAGAGTGKTLTLAARVARLVRDGADPQRLLLLTFCCNARSASRRRRHRRNCRGPAPSTRSRCGCCANTRRASA